MAEGGGLFSARGCTEERSSEGRLRSNAEGGRKALHVNLSDEIEQKLPRPDAGKRKTIEKEEMSGARLNGTRGLPETKIEAPRPR